MRNLASERSAERAITVAVKHVVNNAVEHVREPRGGQAQPTGGATTNVRGVFVLGRSRLGGPDVLG